MYVHWPLLLVGLMSESGDSSCGGARWDTNHHRMASWDGHPACWTCMRRMGKACMSSMTCDICRSWMVETWQKVRRADLRSAKRRLSRAETQLDLGDSRARTIETSVSKIKDRRCTGRGIEAVMQRLDWRGKLGSTVEPGVPPVRV